MLHSATAPFEELLYSEIDPFRNSSLMKNEEISSFLGTYVAPQSLQTRFFVGLVETIVLPSIMY
jgi:hypothetical protein